VDQEPSGGRAGKAHRCEKSRGSENEQGQKEWEEQTCLRRITQLKGEELSSETPQRGGGGGIGGGGGKRLPQKLEKEKKHYNGTEATHDKGLHGERVSYLSDGTR